MLAVLAGTDWSAESGRGQRCLCCSGCAGPELTSAPDGCSERRLTALVSAVPCCLPGFALCSPAQIALTGFDFLVLNPSVRAGIRLQNPSFFLGNETKMGRRLQRFLPHLHGLVFCVRTCTYM